MALDQITSQAIADGAITANDLSTTAIQDKLGYTPANETTVNNQINSALVNPTFTGQSITIPAGTTAERPASPTTGMLRFNTTLGKLEQYDGFDWAIIDAPPIIVSITPTTEIASDNPQSIVISGSNFSTVVSVKLIGNNGAEYTPTTVTRNSSSQITITFAGNDRIDGSLEPYGIRVTNSTGSSAVLEDALNINDVPTWVTASGSLGTVIEDVTMSNITLSATDPESVGITFSIASGALPTGVSLASNGVISGTPNVNDSYNSSGVTHNFTVGASDDAQTINRSFSILRKWIDGSTSDLAVTGPIALNTLGITTNGVYWVNHGSGAYQTYMWLDASSGGGYMLTAKIDTSQNVEWAYGGSNWSTGSAVNESNIQNLNDNDAVSRAWYGYTMQTGYRMVLNSAGSTGLTNHLTEAKTGQVPRYWFTNSSSSSQNGRSNFLGWMSGAGTSASEWNNQANCNHAGFNINGTGYAMRWGISMNNEGDCSTNDSSIGFGTYTNDQYNHNNGVRNANAGGHRWNSDARFAYKGLIFVR